MTHPEVKYCERFVIGYRFDPHWRPDRFPPETAVKYEEIKFVCEFQEGHLGLHTTKLPDGREFIFSDFTARG